MLLYCMTVVVLITSELFVIALLYCSYVCGQISGAWSIAKSIMSSAIDTADASDSGYDSSHSIVSINANRQASLQHGQYVNKMTKARYTSSLVITEYLTSSTSVIRPSVWPT